MAIVCTSRPDFNTCCENAIAAGCTLNPENYQAATSALHSSGRLGFTFCDCRAAARFRISVNYTVEGLYDPYAMEAGDRDLEAEKLVV